MFQTANERHYVHVYSKDPALDIEHDDFNHEVWVDTGDDKHLPCVAGAKPVKFRLRRVSKLERKYVEEVARQQSLAKGLHRLLSFALDGIDPFMVDGQESELAQVSDRVTESQRVADKVFDLFPDALYNELANRASTEEFGDPK
jgi:hypothetical protein